MLIFRVIHASRSSLTRFLSFTTMSGKPLYTYVEPEIIARRMQIGASTEACSSAVKEYVVIDVRDEDEFGEGHLIGANHLPCELWRNPDFVKDTAMKFIGQQEVVLHCYKSQQRGPACARLLAIAYEQHVEKNPDATVPDVRVLRGGFCEFYKHYSNDNTLIEK